MKRRDLFTSVLFAAPALIFAPKISHASVDEKAQALALIDSYVARTFGHVRDGIKRAYQTYLLDEHGKELRVNFVNEDDSVTYGASMHYGMVTKVNQMFLLDGADKPGVPDVLAKATIAWIDGALNGADMADYPDSIMCWRVRPSFSLTERDFETGEPGGKLRIRARAHTWGGYEWRHAERMRHEKDFDAGPLIERYRERVKVAPDLWGHMYGTKGV